MRFFSIRRSNGLFPLAGRRGATLVEVIIGLGALAVSMPLVCLTMGASSKSRMAAAAETRCGWIVPRCMEEVNASRKGESEWFPATVAGEIFPAEGETWALAFGENGNLLGNASSAAYGRGILEIGGNAVCFLASIKGEEGTSFPPSLLRVTVTVEYPAAAPASKRKKIPFHTLLP